MSNSLNSGELTPSINHGLIPLSGFRAILRDPGLLGKVPYYLETPYYKAYPRPARHPEKYEKEMMLKKTEWDALEFAIRVPDAEWTESLGCARFQKAWRDGQGLRKSIGRLARENNDQKEVETLNTKNSRHKGTIAARARKAWAEDTLRKHGMPVPGEVVEDPRKRYALDILTLLLKQSESRKPISDDDSPTTVEAKDAPPLESTKRGPRSAAAAASLRLAEEAARREQVPDSDYFELPDSSDTDWTPRKRSGTATPRLPRRKWARTCSAPAAGTTRSRSVAVVIPVRRRSDSPLADSGHDAAPHLR